MAEPFDSIRASVESLYPDNNVQQITPADARAALELVIANVEAGAMQLPMPRSQLAAALAYWTPVTGGVYYADGLCFRYLADDNTYISDMPGFVPHGVTNVAHWGRPADGVDSRSKWNAAIAYAQARQLATGVEQTIDGGNLPWWTAGPIYISSRQRLRIRGAQMFPVVGSVWAEDTAFFMLSSSDEIVFEPGFQVDGKHLVPGGLRFNSSDKCTALGIAVYGFTEFGIRGLASSGELELLYCKIGQWKYGETGFDVFANRTAVAVDMDGCADFLFQGNKIFYSLMNFRIVDGGAGDILANHTYNGALNEALAYSEPVNIYIDAPNIHFDDNYCDNGRMQFRADRLEDGAYAGPGGSISQNRFHRTGGGSNLGQLEFFADTIAGCKLPGLRLLGNQFDSSVASVLFAVSGTGTFAAQGAMQWEVWGNATKDGTPVDGLPRAQSGDVFSISQTGQLRCTSLSFDGGATSWADYWTTATVALTDSSGHASPTTAPMRYQRVGNMMTVTYNVPAIVTTGMTPGDTLRLPLPVVALGAGAGSVSFATLDVPTGAVQVTLGAVSGQSYAVFSASMDNAGLVNLTVAALTSGVTNITDLTLTYPVGTW